MSETEAAGPSTADLPTTVRDVLPPRPSDDSAPCVLVLGMAGSGKSSFVQVCFITI